MLPVFLFIDLVLYRVFDPSGKKPPRRHYDVLMRASNQHERQAAPRAAPETRANGNEGVAVARDYTSQVSSPAFPPAYTFLGGVP